MTHDKHQSWRLPSEMKMWLEMNSVILMLATVTLLSACGGSGGGINSSFQATDEYGTQAGMMPTSMAGGTSSGLNANIDRLLEAGSSAYIVNWGGSAMTKQLNTATIRALRDYGPNLLKSHPTDVASFCPNYNSLDDDQRLGFWTSFVAALAQAESSFNPASILREGGRGRDSVTGEPLTSEGLLQISYQDQVNYQSSVPAGACDFDYKSDRQYPTRDIRRSIQDPAKNLNCGVAMMNALISQDNRIAGFGDGHYYGVARYWAPLRTPRAIAGIRHRTVNFCRAVTR